VLGLGRGILGDGSSGYFAPLTQSTAVRVIDLPDAVSLAGSNSGSYFDSYCATLATGPLKCWGRIGSSVASVPVVVHGVLRRLT